MSLQAKCSEVSTAWNIPYSSEGEGRTFVRSIPIKTQGRANNFFEKNYQNSPVLHPLPPRKNVPSLSYKGLILRSYK